MTDEKQTIERYVECLRKEIPDIRPYGEEDWDWTWADDGVDLLEGGEVLLAERRFQELILARPDDLDGYEGLALVCRALGRKKDAVMLIEHAVRLAQSALERNLIDQEVLDELLVEQREIFCVPEPEGGAAPMADV